MELTASTVAGDSKRAPPTQLKPFVPGDPRINRAGRINGARNKLQGDFLWALAKDFSEHGKKVIERTRKKMPDRYLSIVAQLIPKQLTIKHDPLGELSDGELIDALDSLRRFLAAREIGGGSTTQGTEGEGA